LLIIPAFVIDGANGTHYMDSVLSICPNFKAKIDTFLSKGGTIYAEGNAVYMIEKLGYLVPGAVDFSNSVTADITTNLVDITVANSTNPIGYAANATGNYLYAGSVPFVNAGNAEVVAKLTANSAPAVFVLKGSEAGGGRIICNLGLPTIGGNSEILSGSRQLEWSFNAFLYAFANSVDVTRSIFNDLPAGVTAGQNAIAYDKIDTFEVRIKVRNLSTIAITDIHLKEIIGNYFTFVDVTTPGVTFNVSGNNIDFSGINLASGAETNIVYRLMTPPVTSTTHANIDSYIAWNTYINASSCVARYSTNKGNYYYNKYRDYTDVMFSADIAADADLNWKNFLGIFYQPFKVFMIMENKERTPAVQTQYVQYIPKDVPYYWVDHSLNVPVLKTPGGKYVDIMKGSNNESVPDFDMSNNGLPDVWLDTASIYPKGYTITEDSVYWQNPWHKIATGDSIPYFEDIDHDGIRAQDLNDDGIPEIGEPGDKIRVWKVTWNINQVAGHQVYDPYCYYEIWVDPPDLVKMAAGIGYVNGTLTDSVPGMFYPYSPDLNNPNLADTSWKHWMDRDPAGNIATTQLIYQSINNYEGYTFIDTAATHYHLLPTDSCVGTVPQPHNEFIAVLSLGGEEVDMYNPRPHRSNYSNIDYKTIFNEAKKTPIRTTYTYYAPLPNPLQFEYLTNNFIIKDSADNTLQKLPADGKAYITFNVDASTEYSYYWIRNAGHDVQYNDPSLAAEGIESLGDGVFGYMVYDIPKGFSNYKIKLPTLNDGSYDINSIVQVDGHPYQQWINNPNTADSISIWEDDFKYHIHIPQLLIPPALCDKNGDGIDDWLDDRGDRFHSPTGYLHDAYMLGDGESYPAGSPNVYPHLDDGMAGQVDEGWSCGSDSTYGSDWFDNLGKVKFSIHAIYEGKGKEGPVDICKGGWLVVEEIFGGSPWVVFSHSLSAFAEGSDLSISSTSSPSVVKIGIDTCYVKHVIQDLNEPHDFDNNFNPYHVDYGYGDATISTYAGGRDPCSLVSPPTSLPVIVDPQYDHKTLTLVPLADPNNPDLAGFPQTENGTFIEAMIKAFNGTDDNWIHTKVTPIIPPELGNTHVVMKYVAYPRPLVPALADPSTGAVLHQGDEIGSFVTGWRFNQPDGEVLVKMGDTLNLLQPTRRAYFMFLISVDESLPPGVYSIPFDITGNKVHYTGVNHGAISYDVPELQFSVAQKTPNGSILNYEKVVIGEGDLTNITVNTTPEFTGLENVKWSVNDVNHTDFSSMTETLPATYNQGSQTEVIDMSNFDKFPAPDTAKIYLLEQGLVNSTNAPAGEHLDITTSEQLNYSYANNPGYTYDDNVYVVPIGPNILINKKIYSINGKLVKDNDSIVVDPGVPLQIATEISTINIGSDIAVNTVMKIKSGQAYDVVTDSLPSYCSYSKPITTAQMGSYIPGQRKTFYIYYLLNQKTCDSIIDVLNLISEINMSYSGQFTAQYYDYPDSSLLVFPSSDLNMFELTSNKSEVIVGDEISVDVHAKNYGVDVKDVLLNIFAIIDGDSIKIGEKHYDLILSQETVDYTVPFTIPDNSVSFWIYSKIVSLDSSCEICENNNNKSLKIVVLGGPWIYNVYANPNPFINEVTFYYELGDDMTEVYINIFTAEGKSIAHLGNCPVAFGPNTVKWNTADVSSGIYYYRITGIDKEGKSHDYTDKIVRK